MTATIRIVRLDTDLLIIKPIKEGASSSNSSREDLSIELWELKLYLDNLGFRANVDYVDNGKDNPYTLKFIGKSLVLRAIWTIPRDRISFQLSDWYGRGIDKSHYARIKLLTASTIKSNECYVTDQRFVKEVSDDIFNHIKQEVLTAHAPFSPRSYIMEQLEKDLAAIEKYNEVLFTTPTKAKLALASVMFHFRAELKAKTAVAPYRLIKGDSILAPLYEQLITAFRTYLGSEEHLLPLYHDHVTKLHIGVTQAVSVVPLPQNTKSAHDPSALEAFQKGFFKEMKQSFVARRNAIDSRIANRQWGQDVAKNMQKREAITAIIDAIDANKTVKEVSTLVNTKQAVLRQSTSTLPTFFRSKVSTVDILDDYGRFLILP